MADKEKDKASEEAGVSNEPNARFVSSLISDLKGLADGSPWWFKWLVAPILLTILGVVALILKQDHGLGPRLIKGILTILNHGRKDVRDLGQSIIDNFPEIKAWAKEKGGELWNKMQEIGGNSIEKIEQVTLFIWTAIQNYFTDLVRRRRWRNIALWYLGFTAILIFVGLMPFQQLRPLLFVAAALAAALAFRATRSFALPGLAVFLLLMGLSVLSPWASQLLYSGQIQNVPLIPRAFLIAGFAMLFVPFSLLLWLLLKGIGSRENEKHLSMAENLSNLFRIGLLVILSWLVVGNWIFAVYTLLCFGSVLAWGALAPLMPTAIRSTRRVFQFAFGLLLIGVALDQVAKYEPHFGEFVYNTESKITLGTAKLFDHGRENNSVAKVVHNWPFRIVTASTNLIDTTNFSADSMITGTRIRLLKPGEKVQAFYSQNGKMRITRQDWTGRPYRLVSVPINPDSSESAASEVYGYVKESDLKPYDMDEARSQIGKTEPVSSQQSATNTPYAEVKFPANQLWTQTGILIPDNSQVTIEVSGDWINGLYQATVGPGGISGTKWLSSQGGPMDWFNGLAVFASIGDSSSKAFPVGNHWEGFVAKGGMTSIGINDDLLGDNQGFMVARIYINNLPGSKAI